MADQINIYKMEAAALNLTAEETRQYFRERILQESQQALKLKEVEVQLRIKEKQVDLELKIKEKEIDAKISLDSEKFAQETKIQADKLEQETKIHNDKLQQDIILKQHELDQKNLALELEIKSKERMFLVELEHKRDISQTESNERLEVVRITGEVSGSSSTHINKANGLTHFSKLLDLSMIRSESRQEIESFLTKFKRLCILHEVPEEFQGKLLASRLGGNLVEIFNRIPLEKANSFMEIEKALLQKFMLDSDYYSDQFKNLTPFDGESTAEYFRRLRQVLERWLILERTPNSGEGMINFMLTNQYISRLKVTNKPKLVFLRERAPEDLEHLSNLADLYDTSHALLKQDTANKPHFNSFGRQPQSGQVSFIIMVLEILRQTDLVH